MGEELLTVAEAAALAKVAPLTIRRRIKDGTLKAFKFGGVVRIRRADLEAALKPIEARHKSGGR